MAKIRALRPEFFTDERVVELSPLARLLFQGMWIHACDNGHIEDRPRQLKLRILPADDCDVEALVEEVVAQGMVERVDGWLIVTRLGAHQKIDKRYFLRCDFPGCKDTQKSLSTRRVAPPEHEETPPEPLSNHDVTTPGPHCGHVVTTERPSTDGDGDGDGDGDTPSLRSGGPGGALAPSRGLALVDSPAPTATAKADAKTKRGTRIPDNWQPSRTKGNIDAESGHPAEWLRNELDKFRDYWSAKTGKDAAKLDWDATWRNWIRNSKQYQAPRPNHPRTAASMTDADWDQIMADARAKDEADERRTA